MTLGPGGYVGSTFVAVPAGPESLEYRIRFSEVGEQSYTFDRRLKDDEQFVVFSYGHFLPAP